MAEKMDNYPAKSAPFTVLLYPADVAAATAKAKEQGLSFSALVRNDQKNTAHVAAVFSRLKLKPSRPRRSPRNRRKEMHFF